MCALPPHLFDARCRVAHTALFRPGHNRLIPARPPRLRLAYYPAHIRPRPALLPYPHRAPGFDQFLTSFRAGPTRHRIASTALRPSLALLAASTSRPPPPLLCLGSSRYAAPAPTPSRPSLDALMFNRSRPPLPATITPRHALQSGAVHSATPDLAHGPGRFGWGPPDSDCCRPYPPARVRGAEQNHS